MNPAPTYHLAYVFERFPSFTQTFCAREVAELKRSGVRVQLFSIRDTSAEADSPCHEEFRDETILLPPEKQLVEDVKRLKDERQFPQSVVLTLRNWDDKPDKMRVYEAAWIGLKLRASGVTHVHTHFAGIGARTCWWIAHFYGITFSFTGHANDLFCPQDPSPVSQADLMRDAAAIITVSDFTARWITDNHPVAKSKLTRIYNGLHLAPFREIRGKRCAASPPLILSVGRLIEKKGYFTLIDACARLRDQDIAFQCKIVGEGPDEIALADQITSLSLGDRVHLVGSKCFPEILALLQETTLFALACATEQDGGMDNLPTVIMEAMAAGLPCVSTRLAGVPEMVIEDSTGVLTNERDPDAFAAAISRFLGDPAFLGKCGTEGAASAEKLFDLEKNVPALFAALVARCDIPEDASLAAHHPQLKRAHKQQRWHRLKRVLVRKTRKA